MDLWLYATLVTTGINLGFLGNISRDHMFETYDRDYRNLKKKLVDVYWV